MGWTFGAIAVVLLGIPGTAIAQDHAVGRDFSRATLVVRTYNNYGVSNEDLRAARTHADEIFKDAGIEISWKDCWYRDKEATDASQCRQPLGTEDVILRLQTTHPAPGTRFVSMGFSLVNVAEGVPFLATVFTDFVSSVARKSNVSFSLLLGRAIAHELGHLLLNQNDHPRTGLMRADWTRATLLKNEAADWAFREDEVASIRAAAAHRGLSTVDYFTPAASSARDAPRMPSIV